MSTSSPVMTYAPTVPGPNFTLADFTRVVAARRRLVIGVTIATILLAVAVALMLPTVYSSAAVVMLDARKNNITDASAVLSSQPSADPSTLPNQIQILSSRALASKVITQLALYNDPEFNPTLAPPGFLGMLNPRNWSGTPAPAADTAKIHDLIMDNFLKHISADANGLSSAVTVTATSKDAAKASRIANALVEAYVADQIAFKRDATNETATWLSNRINDLGGQMQATNETIQRIKAQNGIAETTPGSSLIDQQLAGINGQVVQARSDLAEKRATQTRLQQLGNDLADASQVISSPLIAQLRNQQVDLARQEADLNTKYGPLNPKLQALEAQRKDLDQKIAQEVNRIGSSVSSDVAVSRGHLQSLQSSLERAEQISANQNMARGQLEALQANATSTRNTYETFVQRLRGIQDQDGAIAPDSRIISAAPIPQYPASPKRTLIVLASLPLGLLLGVLAALASERFGHLWPTAETRIEPRPSRPALRDTRVRPAAIATPSWNGAPILGEVANTASLRSADYVIDWPSSRFARACTAIVRQLESRGGDGAIVALTAPEPGDSKSVIAVSLARAASRMGKKTIIVDCDPAHRSASALHAEVENGLYEVLTGAVSLNEALVKDPRSGAYLLSLARRPTHAAAMYSSPQMARLLDILRDACDFVVLDCGPTLTAPETALLARQADATLLVSRRERLRARSLSNAAEMLRNAQAAPMGLVIAS